MKKAFFLALVVSQLVACSAEIGSEAWCNDLKDKAKDEWTAGEAKDYAKHCLFR
jgi:hypothetical protein